MKEKKELQTVSSGKQLAIYLPDTVAQELRNVRTVNDALQLADSDTYPPIGVLRREYGEQKVEALIKLYLIDLCENVNLKRGLNDNQIANIAREIVGEFYNLNIADVHVVFRQAKHGVFGEFYEGLDMPKVLTWFRLYFNERCAAAAQESINKAGTYRTGGDRRDAERWTQLFNKLEKARK